MRNQQLKLFIAIIVLFTVHCSLIKAEHFSKYSIYISKDSVKKEQPKKISFFIEESSRKDTIIDHFHIEYTIRENNELIPCAPYRDNPPEYYAIGQEVILNIKYMQKEIFNKVITRDFFASYIKERFNWYAFNRFELLKVEKECSIFEISFCMPDSDVCYFFEINVNAEGKYKIKEIIEEYGEDDY